MPGSLPIRPRDCGQIVKSSSVKAPVKELGMAQAEGGNRLFADEGVAARRGRVGVEVFRGWEFSRCPFGRPRCA